jgi:deoxycytidylate deaminase
MSETAEKEESATFNELLKPFNLFDWRPRIECSVDDNYMEMVMLVTRNSICMQGYMACIIVDPTVIKTSCCTVEELERCLHGAIIGISNNEPLFSELDSDVHAEIGALGLACRLGNATEGCTAYITMPPCKRCFAALLSSGIKRIVSRRSAAVTILQVAEKHGIDMVLRVETPEQLARVHLLAQGENQDGQRVADKQAEIEEIRKQRKEAKGRRKEDTKRRREEDPAFKKNST